MPDHIREALAKWHDKKAGRLEHDAETVPIAGIASYLGPARRHRATAALLREQAAELAELRAVVEAVRQRCADGLPLAAKNDHAEAVCLATWVIDTIDALKAKEASRG